ncbi:MAG TPA: hypothetical protein VGI03_00665 [Verrucomicrobiae bacterium]|jgi:hypothetical protein
MTERHLLSLEKRESEIIRFTLVINAPYSYFVEESHEPTQPFKKAHTMLIEATSLSNYQVNGVPLIKLVETKFEELAKLAA